jgi:hypothetical protein
MSQLFEDNPVIARLKQDRELREMQVRVYANSLWATMTANEKTGIRFGLFPANKMSEAGISGFEIKEICVALMACAKQNGGMRA